MEKTLSRTFSYLFHPLIMTSLGMLILFNSGTSLSVLQSEVKRISIIVTVLFTFVFPASMVIILYITKMIVSADLHERKERIIPMALSIVMYLFSYFVMKSIPQLSSGHVVFLLCPPAALFIAMILNWWFMKPSIHMLGIGMLLGLVLVLILVYGASLQIIFIATVLIGGILGTSRLVLKIHGPNGILAGFSTGFFVTVMVMTCYVFLVLQ
ncbi:MAG: hypothetical protein WD577_10825 [Bacteroidales bacterium]